MKTLDTSEKVDDTAENLAICQKYCGACPTYKVNNLSASPPYALFCARERTSISSQVKTIRCYCPACEIFTKYGLSIGYFCTKK